MDLKKYQTLTCLALATVATAGSVGIPSGHLYAQLMTHCSLSEFESVIATLRNGELITETSYLLKITEKGKPLGLQLAEIIQSV